MQQKKLVMRPAQEGTLPEIVSDMGVFSVSPRLAASFLKRNGVLKRFKEAREGSSKQRGETSARQAG